MDSVIFRSEGSEGEEKTEAEAEVEEELQREV